MLKSRLYLQIYFIIIVSLLSVVLVFGVLGRVFDRDRTDNSTFDTIGKLVYLSLPAVDAPRSAQEAAIERLGRELGVDLSLFGGDLNLIASHGKLRSIPSKIKQKNGWRHRHHREGWVLKLPDGRWLSVSSSGHRKPPPILRLATFLAGIALAVGIVAYPFVRRLTGRLERLQQGVDKIGAGDLSFRVRVEGRDEVAKLAESFNVATSKIETLLGSHRLLLANASHELRTPLSRIRLGIEMLGGDVDQKRFDALQEDIVELDTLIDEILLMSRLDAGSHHDLCEDVDLVAFIAEECAHYSDCIFSGTVPDIQADPRLLARLLRNLLQNAQTHGAPPIRVHLEHHGDNISLTVSDGGDGFVDLDPTKVFQPFYRASGKQNVRGYGLGLALVKQIAEAHDGTVSIVARSEFSSGIRVILPVKQSV